MEEEQEGERNGKKNYKERDLQKKRGNETGRDIERSIGRGRTREIGSLGFPLLKFTLVFFLAEEKGKKIVERLSLHFFLPCFSLYLCSFSPSLAPTLSFGLVFSLSVCLSLSLSLSLSVCLSFSSSSAGLETFPLSLLSISSLYCSEEGQKASE